MELAPRPLLTTLRLLSLDLGLAGLFVLAGLALFDDQAEFFRELMPGTFLSFAQLLFIAAVALAVHRCTGKRRLRETFFGLSAIVFLTFAFDEITQAAVFLGDFLEDDLNLGPAGAFNDLEAMILVLLFTGTALVLLRRAVVLWRHPLAVALFFVGGSLGVASQSLDSYAQGTQWAFVAEETLKLTAEVFLLGGFLVVLRDVTDRKQPRLRGVGSRQQVGAAQL